MIDAHREEYGVEPICRVLGSPRRPTTRSRRAARALARAVRDAELLGEIRRVHEANDGVYGARKVWWQLQREGIEVARCTVERLMRDARAWRACRGQERRTTIPDEQAAAGRRTWSTAISGGAPNRLWVADFTYVRDVVGRRLRGVRDRRVQPADRRLEGRHDDEDQPRAGHAGDGVLGPRPRGQPVGRASFTTPMPAVNTPASRSPRVSSMLA